MIISAIPTGAGDIHHHLGGQLVVPGQGEALGHAVLVEQDVRIRKWFSSHWRKPS
jgi:hypothetical protein